MTENQRLHLESVAKYNWSDTHREAITAALAEIDRLTQLAATLDSVNNSLAASIREKEATITTYGDRVRELEAERNRKHTDALFANNARRHAEIDLQKAQKCNADLYDRNRFLESENEKLLEQLNRLLDEIAAIKKTESHPKPPSYAWPLRIEALEDAVAKIKGAKIVNMSNGFALSTNFRLQVDD